MSALLGMAEAATGASSVGGMLGNLAMSSVMGDAQKDTSGTGGIGKAATGGFQDFLNQLMPQQTQTFGSGPNSNGSMSFTPTWTPQSSVATISNPYLQFLVGGKV